MKVNKMKMTKNEFQSKIDEKFYDLKSIKN